MNKNTPDVTVRKINEAECEIFIEDYSLERAMIHHFSAYVPNYRFMSAYKKGTWSGKICAINKNKIGIGLVPEVISYCKIGGFSIDCDVIDVKDFSKNNLQEFIELLQLPFNPYDYQLQASFEAIQRTKLNINMPTSSGKSLVQYIIASFMMYNDAKTLIIVPTVNLVNQLFSDFIDYGFPDPYNNCHRITAGKEKTLVKPITISTYQSLANVPKNSSFFKEVDCLMIDEVQSGKAVTLQEISKRCTNAHYRIGLSGTYPEPKTTDWLAIVGIIGPIKKFVSYQKLREDKRVAGLKIKDLIINHPEDVREENYMKSSNSFQKEVEYINSLEYRNSFINQIVNKFKKNSIILFTRKAHGKVLRDLIEASGKKVFYIDGDVSGDEREIIRKTMEKSEGAVLIGSFGTISAGMSIKNIHNIIFASNYKSKVKVIQSIGRGLRISETKDEVTIYDIIDNLQFRPPDRQKYVNHTLKHYAERKKFYDQEGYTDRVVKKFKLFKE